MVLPPSQRIVADTPTKTPTENFAGHCGLSENRIVGRELRTSPSGIGNSSYELPEDLQGCDEAALPLSHTKLLVRGGT